jgi:hypothetical protein
MGCVIVPNLPTGKGTNRFRRGLSTSELLRSGVGKDHMTGRVGQPASLPHAQQPQLEAILLLPYYCTLSPRRDSTSASRIGPSVRNC